MVKNKDRPFLEIELKIGHVFSDPELLKRSLTHRSIHADLEQKNCLHNETLEFLGDAVLSLIAAESLFRASKRANEGDLSRLRAEYVCKDNLVKAAHRIGLIDHMVVSRSLRMSGIMGSSKILSDVLEAIIGAVYLDGGLVAAQQSVEAMLGPVPKMTKVQNKDPKTELQEKIQHLSMLTPNYQVERLESPAHESIFVAVARVGEHFLAEASGKSKKEASLASAAKALARLATMSDEELKAWVSSASTQKIA